MYENLESLLRALGVRHDFAFGEAITWYQVGNTAEGQACADAVLAFEYEDLITAAVVDRQSGEPVSVVSFEAELREGRWQIRPRDEQEPTESVHRFREAVAGMTPDSL